MAVVAFSGTQGACMKIGRVCCALLSCPLIIAVRVTDAPFPCHRVGSSAAASETNGNSKSSWFKVKETAARDRASCTASAGQGILFLFIDV
jgi:hypothetical protein